MTDQPPPEMNDSSDVEIERTLRDGLVTRPLNKEAQARLHAAAAQAWRAATLTSGNTMVARQHWRRRIGYAVAASLIAVAVSFFAMRPAQDSSMVGSIARLNNGGIEVRSWVFGHRTLQVGDALRVGDAFTARGGSLVILPGGGTLRIAAGSVLGVTGLTQLSMERGLIYVDLVPSDSTKSNQLQVTTRAGTVEHVGTEFEVMSDEQTVRIRVREGQIRLLRQSQPIVANAGTELLVTAGGQVTNRAVDTFGSDWQWTLALAPDYEIEGRPLIEFLRWVSREVGRPLEFANAHARETADNTILHGSVKGQSPADALPSVLATTSLAYEISADALRIN